MADIFDRGQEYLKGLFDTAQQKQAQLQQARDDKLVALTNPKPITIAGYEDADTIKTTDNQTYRTQALDGTMLDAVEGKHGTKPIDMYGGTGAYQKSPAAMTKQRQLVGQMVGKPESQVTEQDFIDVSNWQLVQQVADQVNGPGVWQAPFGRGTAPINLSGKFVDAEGKTQEASLDIAATVQSNGKDRVGRLLGTVGTAEGIDTTTPAAHDRLRNIYASSSVPQDTSDERSRAYYGELAKTGNNKVTARVANAGKGFLYRAAEGIAQTADLVPEVIEYGYKKLTGNPKSDWSDVEGLFTENTSNKIKNFLGYDESKMQAVAEEAKSAVLNAYDKGDYWSVLKALGHAIMTPEVAGESGGFIASMLLPGSIGVKALRTASGMTKVVEAAVAAEEAALVAAGRTVSSAEKTAMTARALKAAEDEAGVGYKLAKMVAENPGYVNYAEQVARDSEKEYQEKYGTEMDGYRRTGAFLLGLVSGKLDAAMGTMLVKGKDPVARLMRAAYNEAPEAVQKSTAIAIAKATGMPIGRIVGAMAEEGFTEGLQTALENTAGRYNSEAKGGSLSELFTDRENLAEIARDAVIGAAGGAQFAAPSTAKDAMTGGVDKVTKELHKIADRAGQNTPEATAARAQQEDVENAQSIGNELAKKVNLLTPELKAKFVVSMDSLRLPSDTEESTEIKNIATDVLQGNDNKGVLGADIDDAEAGRRIKNAVIAADGSIIANIDNVVDNVQKLRPNMSTEQIRSIVDNAFVVRNALETVTGKTTSEVGREVTTGSRGFETYFKNVMHAQAVGDTVTADANAAKLEAFTVKQAAKVATIEGLVEEMERKLDSAAKVMVDASQGGISYEQALRAATENLGERSKKAERGRVGKVSYGTGTYEMSYKTVAERMMMSDAQKESFRGGGFSGLANMRDELKAMKILVDQVFEVESAPAATTPVAPAPTPAPIAPLKDRVRAWVDRKLSAEGATLESVSSAVMALGADKAESKQHAMDYIQEMALANAPINEDEVVVDESEPAAESAIDEVEPTVDAITNEIDYEALAAELVDELKQNDEFDGDINADLYAMDIPIDNDYDAMYFGDEGMSIDHTDSVFDMWMLEGGEEKNAEIKNTIREQRVLEDELQSMLVDEMPAEAIEEMQDKIAAVRDRLKEYRGYSSKLVGEISKRFGGSFFGIELQKSVNEGGVVQDQLLKAANVTGLSYKEVEIRPEARQMVKQALAKFGYEVMPDGAVEMKNSSKGMLVSSSGKLYSTTELQNNPALTLLLKPVGKNRVEIDSNVANAMYAAQMSYLKDNIGEFTVGKTDEEMMAMFGGFVSYDAINPMAVFADVQKYGGTFDKFVAADAGAEVMTYLGLKAGDMSTPELYQGFVAGFGSMLINDAITNGLLKEVKVDQATVLMAGRDEQGKIRLLEARDAIAEEARKVENEYLIDTDRSRGPSRVPPKADRRVTIHHQPYADATKIQAETIHTLEAMAMKVNEGYETLMEIFEGDEAGLLKQIGVEEIDEKTQTFNTRVSLEAANRAHSDGLMYLRRAKEKFGNAVMYFKWFVTMGGRFNLDSIEVNPQTNKQLHRWLVTAVDAESTIPVVEAEKLANYEIGQELHPIVIALAYGIMQGFGFGVDKMNQDDVLLGARQLINMDKAQLIAHAKQMMADADGKAFDHVGQMAVAVSAVARFREAIANGEESFTTSLTVEFDGLTNGFSFKVMQYPLDDYEQWLPKIGVLVEGSKHGDAESMNAVRASKTEADTYETIGMVMKPRLFSPETAADDLKSAKKAASRKNATFDMKQVETAARVADKLVRYGIAPKMAIVDGIVSKTVREIMKNPTMIFNYGAGIKKIVDNVTNKMVEDTIDALYRLAQADPNAVSEILGIADVNGVVEALRTELLTDKSNQFVRNTLYDAYKVMYGAPVGDALEAKFGEYIKLNRAINKAFELMYEVFTNKAAEVATEMFNAGKLTGHYGSASKVKGLTLDALNTGDAITVIRAMVVRGLVPAVRTPDTDGNIQQLVVFDRATVDIVKAAKSRDSKEAPMTANVLASTEGGKGKYIKLFTRLVGAPGAAGVVLMTHVKDGLTIGSTIIKYPHLGVHDASVWGLAQAADGTKQYNKEWYEINKTFSDIDAIIDALARTLKAGNVTGNVEVMDTLKMYQKKISKNRVELYSRNAKIGQQVGMNGTMYEVDAADDRKKVMKKVATAIGEISAGLPTKAKNLIKVAAKQHANNPTALMNAVMAIVGKDTMEYNRLNKLKMEVASIAWTPETRREAVEQKAVEDVQSDTYETDAVETVEAEAEATTEPVVASSSAAQQLMEGLSKVNPSVAQIIMNDRKDC